MAAAIFDSQVTPAERAIAPGLDVVHQLRGVLGLHAFVPVFVVHHHDRRPVAGAQALEFDERERAGRVRLPHADAKLVGERLGHALGAQEGARQRAADLQHVLADRRPVEHHVVARDVLHFGRRHVQNLRDMTHAVRRQVSLLLLDQVERGEHRRRFAIRWVFREDLVERRAAFGRELKRRPLVRELALGLVQPLVVRHQRVKAHRSTSPMTTSVEPMTAITSAIIPPTSSFASPWHA